VEEAVLTKIENEFSRTVGDFVQKVEIYPRDDAAVVVYARESRSDILDDLPAAAHDLRYVPIGEAMGRNQR
jgi:hypothetical protein